MAVSYCDFVVKYHPWKDEIQDITERVLYSLIVRRIKNKKPCVCFLGGDSGEGKSWTSLRLQEVLAKVQGYDMEDYMETMNVYTPLEYAEKLDRILYDKNHKEANIFTIHEARELVRAKKWHSFLSQTVSDVNAMSRQVKRLILIIISQFIRDITRDVRYTINFYMKVRRPRDYKPAQLKIYKMWKDDRDLEKPKLRKRKVKGYLKIMNKDGSVKNWKKYAPNYFEINKPSKEVRTKFENRDFAAKSQIIRKKLDKLVKEMEDEITDGDSKIETMVKFYTNNPRMLNNIGKRKRRKWKIKDEVREMHGLTRSEKKQFEQRLKEELEKNNKQNTK